MVWDRYDQGLFEILIIQSYGRVPVSVFMVKVASEERYWKVFSELISTVISYKKVKSLKSIITAEAIKKF